MFKISAFVWESTGIRERWRISCVSTNQLAAITSAVRSCALWFTDDSLVPPVGCILEMFKGPGGEAH